jgi:phosphoglycolate phosphatase
MSDFNQNAAGRKIVLLDLDGTLVESGPGIVASVTYVYQTLNVPMPTQKALQNFMGPPIVESLVKYGVPQELADTGVELYRKVYMHPYFHNPDYPDHSESGELVPGMFLGNAYPGVLEACDALREAGFVLALATAKPEPQAYPVCEHFGITGHIDALYGASLDESRRHKADVIRYALAELDFNPQTDRVVMVGDRDTDVDGAAANGIETIGVRWGYAQPGELEEHGAVAIAETTDNLPEIVESYFAGQSR